MVGLTCCGSSGDSLSPVDPTLLARAGWVEVGERIWLLSPPDPATDGPEGNSVLIGGAAGWVLVDPPPESARVGEIARALEDASAGQEIAALSVVATSGSRLRLEALALLAEAVPGFAIHTHEAATLPDSPYDVHTLSSVRVLELGDRQVVLIHPGPAAGDDALIVTVSDSPVVVLGELLPQADSPASLSSASGRSGWPGALDLALTLIRPDAPVIARFGVPVDRARVEDARDSLELAHAPAPPAGERPQLPLV